MLLYVASGTHDATSSVDSTRPSASRHPSTLGRTSLDPSRGGQVYLSPLSAKVHYSFAKVPKSSTLSLKCRSPVLFLYSAKVPVLFLSSAEVQHSFFKVAKSSTLSLGGVGVIKK